MYWFSLEINGSILSIILYDEIDINTRSTLILDLIDEDFEVKILTLYQTHGITAFFIYLPQYSSHL